MKKVDTQKIKILLVLSQSLWNRNLDNAESYKRKRFNKKRAEIEFQPFL